MTVSIWLYNEFSSRNLLRREGNDVMVQMLTFYHLFLITSAPCHCSVMTFTGRRLFVLRIFSFSYLLDFVFIHFPVVLFNSLVVLLKRVNGQLFFSFSSPENVEKV